MLDKQTIKRKLYLWGAQYFMWWAALSFRRWRPRVIAVTGSVGKTTMLHLLELQLGEQAHYSHNANSAFGIAFDVVGLRGVTDRRRRWLYLLLAVPWRALTYRRRQEFYVVEIDGERPHEATMIADWLKPEVSLWISVGNSHAVYFDEQVASGAFTTVEEAIAYEFASIPRATGQLVMIDGTNELMRRNVEDVSAQIIMVNGVPDAYTVTPTDTRFTISGINFTFQFPAPKEISVQLQMLVHLADYLQIPVASDVSKFRMPPSRSNFFRGKNGLKLIDSSYNAHLMSMRSMIEMFQQMDVPHKWLVIGDMVEQGKGEADQHCQLGELLATTDAEVIVLVGRRTAKYTLPVLQQHDRDQVYSFEKTQDALAFIEQQATGQETLLLKGSQYLEWIVEKLLADPSDVAKLARQEPAARRRRESRGLL